MKGITAKRQRAQRVLSSVPFVLFVVKKISFPSAADLFRRSPGEQGPEGFEAAAVVGWEYPLAQKG